MRRWISAVVFAFVAVSFAVAEDDPKPLTPEEAAKKVDQQVVMQMEVKSSALRDGNCFLNSKEDFRDAKNFTVFIGRDAVAKFKEAKIEDPAAHFKGKTVQVKGKVKLYKEKPEIALTGPEEIKIVEKK